MESNFKLNFGIPLNYNEQPVIVKELVIREISGVEEEILLSKKFDVYTKIDKVIANVIVKAIAYDAKGNPLEIEGFKDIIAKYIAPIDKTYLLIFLRVISLGSDFEMEYTCPNPECKARLKIKVDLSLFTPKVPEVSDYEYEITAPSGKVFKARLPVGPIAEKLFRLSPEESGFASKAILYRLVSIDGQQPTLKDVEALSIKDRNFLRNQFAKREGELDLTIESVCSICGYAAQIPIDLAQEGFFYPKQ